MNDTPDQPANPADEATSNPPPPPTSGSVADDDAHGDGGRLDGNVMSFGDHLEELRRRSIAGLIGLVLATLLSLLFAKRIMGLVLQPAMAVLRAHGQPTQLQQLSPPDTFLTYLKMALLSGLILAMPWILWQIWQFVSVGLYRNEQRFLKLFAPLSLGLFVVGVLFMYLVVLPVVLNFFVSFGESVTVGSVSPVGLQRFLISGDAESSDSAIQPKYGDSNGVLGDGDNVNLDADTNEGATTIPVLKRDPPNPPVGYEWVNTKRRTRCVMTPDGVLESQLQSRDEPEVVRSQFGLNFYVSFVLTMSLAFGIAFELPLVILFLIGTGIATADQLASSRRYVILGIVAAAAILTPPDVLSQILLAVPMIILFEGALWASRFFVKRESNSVESQHNSA